MYISTNSTLETFSWVCEEWRLYWPKIIFLRQRDTFLFSYVLSEFKILCEKSFMRDSKFGFACSHMVFWFCHYFKIDFRCVMWSFGNRSIFCRFEMMLHARTHTRTHCQRIFSSRWFTYIPGIANKSLDVSNRWHLPIEPIWNIWTFFGTHLIFMNSMPVDAHLRKKEKINSKNRITELDRWHTNSSIVVVNVNWSHLHILCYFLLYLLYAFVQAKL